MPGPPPMTWEIPVAAFLHGVGFVVMFLVGTCASRDADPLFAPEEFMVVEMAGPAPMTTRLPQKAERTPDLLQGAPVTAPEPPPKNPSDLAFQTPEAPKQQGDPAADRRREELIADMRRQAALKDLNAPIGTTDRQATSPDGVAGEAGTGTGALGDPELRKWVEAARQAAAPNWHPIPTLCQQSPTLEVKVLVVTDGNGRPTAAPEVYQKSGNSSFDQSAKRAIEMTGNFPPLPSKYAGGFRGPVTFACKDL